MSDALPDSEKTNENEKIDSNVLQTKEIPSAKPDVPVSDQEPKNSDHSEHSNLPPDNIPIPEEKDPAFDSDVTEGYSIDPD